MSKQGDKSAGGELQISVSLIIYRFSSNPFLPVSSKHELNSSCSDLTKMRQSNAPNSYKASL